MLTKANKNRQIKGEDTFNRGHVYFLLGYLRNRFALVVIQ